MKHKYVVCYRCLIRERTIFYDYMESRLFIARITIIWLDFLMLKVFRIQSFTYRAIASVIFFLTNREFNEWSIVDLYSRFSQSCLDKRVLLFTSLSFHCVTDYLVSALFLESSHQMLWEKTPCNYTSQNDFYHLVSFTIFWVCRSFRLMTDYYTTVINYNHSFCLLQTQILLLDWYSLLWLMASVIGRVCMWLHTSIGSDWKKK